MLESFGDKPWKRRHDWAKGVITSGSPAGPIAAWIVAIALWWLSGIWILGLAVAAIAVYTTLRWRKFGRSTLRLLTLPGVIGGKLAGAVEVPAKIRSLNGVKIQLVCTETTRSGSGENTSSEVTKLWEETQHIQTDLLEADRQKTGIPIIFDIPADQLESDHHGRNISWTLVVTADVTGVDYSAKFEVPVFRPREGKPETKHTGESQQIFDDYLPPSTSSIRVTDCGDSLQIHFPPAPNLKSTLVAFFWIALCSTGLWYLIEFKAPILMSVAAGMFDVLMLYGLWSAFFHTTKVTASPEGLIVSHRMPLPLWTNKIAREDIRSIGVTGTGHEKNIMIVVMGGRTLPYFAGHGIRDRRHGKWLVNRIKQALKLQE